MPKLCSLALAVAVRIYFLQNDLVSKKRIWPAAASAAFNQGYQSHPTTHSSDNVFILSFI